MAPYLAKGMDALALAPGGLYSTVPEPGVGITPIRVHAAPGRAGSRERVFETRLPVGKRGAEPGGEREAPGVSDHGMLQARIVKQSASDPGTLVVDTGRPPVRTGCGRWSPWFTVEAGARGGVRKGAVRLKPLCLQPEAGRVQIVYSEIYPATGFTYPEDLAEDIFEQSGPYLEHAALEGHIPRYEETVFEEMEYQIAWYARTARYPVSYTHLTLPTN